MKAAPRGLHSKTQFWGILKRKTPNPLQKFCSLMEIPSDAQVLIQAFF
jgi:hypothetical protein